MAPETRQKLTPTRFCSSIFYNLPCPGGEIGRHKGLNELSTQEGNTWCEWSQIRGNLNHVCSRAWQSRAKPSSCNRGKRRDLTAPA